MHDYYNRYLISKIQYLSIKRNIIKQLGGNKNPIKKTLMLAFDFDKTISKIAVPEEVIKMYGRYDPVLNLRIIYDLTEKFGSKYIMSDPFLDATFTNWLREIKCSHNTKIIIVSFGLSESIKLALEKHGILDIFDYIITPEMFGLSNGHEYILELAGKNKMIKLAQHKFLNQNIQINDSDIMLIDDHPTNIDFAKENYATSLVFPRCGMTYKNVEEIQYFIYNQINNP